MITIQVPTSLRRFAEQRERLELQAETVGEALQAATEPFPRLRAQLYAADGRLRGFVNVFVNARDIRHLERERTALRPGDVITLLPAIAGG